MIYNKYKIVNEAVISVLAKNYNILDYPLKLASLLKCVYPAENFELFSKYELHKVLNATLLQNYKGEEVLKYMLSKTFMNKRNLIAAFEIKVNNSRVDFLTINGSTTSYEIKSELDNLSKLSKQMMDYLLAFEYNYLVIDARHFERANDLISEKFGLWCYKEGKFKKMRKAILNDKIEPEVQLNLLTKKELFNSFPECGGVLKKILNSLDSNSINRQFKVALKDRYRRRWDFLVANEEQIFPIDIQFFFNTQIEPSDIYYH
jgi:hypothetical protein